jgi:SWI/SNF-related matrix-associated actin-dependent regulator of chromatin subfamily B protein 1
MTPEMFARLIAQENNLPIQQEHEIAYSIKRKIENHRPYQPASHEEWLKTIELDIRVDKVNLKDRFEWDIANPNNSPEDFARDMCREMGLNGEFCVRIAHQIRDQIILHQKLGERDFKRTREHAKDWLRLDDEGWEPKLEVLDADDLRKIERLKKRELRYINRIR